MVSSSTYLARISRATTSVSCIAEIRVWCVSQIAAECTLNETQLLILYWSLTEYNLVRVFQSARLAWLKDCSPNWTLCAGFWYKIRMCWIQDGWYYRPVMCYRWVPVPAGIKGADSDIPLTVAFGRLRTASLCTYISVWIIQVSRHAGLVFSHCRWLRTEDLVHSRRRHTRSLCVLKLVPD